MEPLQKVRLLHAIGLAQMLALVPVRTKSSPSSGAKGGGASGRPPAGGQKGWLSAGNDDEEEDDDDEEGAEEELGEVVNAFVLELLGCWSSYEDLLTEGASAGARAGGGGSNIAGGPSPLSFYIYPLPLTFIPTFTLSFLYHLILSSFPLSFLPPLIFTPSHFYPSMHPKSRQEQVTQGL